MGILTSARCLARSLEGFPAGCSGKPRNASPPTPGKRRKRLRLRRHPPAERFAARDQRQRRTAIARLPPPRRGRRHAPPPAHRAACCLFPYREIDSAASQCRARRDRQQSFPSTNGSFPRPPHARTRNTRAPAAAGSAAQTPSHRDGSQSGAIARRLLSSDLTSIHARPQHYTEKGLAKAKPARKQLSQARSSESNIPAVAETADHGRKDHCRTGIRQRRGSPASAPSARQTAFRPPAPAGMQGLPRSRGDISRASDTGRRRSQSRDIDRR